MPFSHEIGLDGAAGGGTAGGDGAYLLKIASCEIFGLVYLRHNIRKFARMLSGNPENIVVKVFSYCLFFGVMRVYKVEF